MTTTLDLSHSTTGLAIELRIVTDQPTSTPMSVWVRYGTDKPVPVRGLEGLTGYPASFVVLDYTIPYQTTLTYEIQVGADYDSASIESFDSGQAWLRDVLYPDDSIALTITASPSVKTSSRTALLSPIGRSNVVAVTDVRSGRTGMTVLTTFTASEAQAMRRLFATGHVLLLTGPASWHLGPVYWVALGVEERRIGLATSEVVQWSVEWVEVDPPEALLLRVPRTYAEAQTTYVTYLAMRTDQYAAVLYPVVGGRLMEPVGARGVPAKQRRWSA